MFWHQVSRNKKPDPRTDKIDLKQKAAIIRNMWLPIGELVDCQAQLEIQTIYTHESLSTEKFYTHDSLSTEKFGLFK